MVRETEGQVKYRSSMEPIADVYGGLPGQEISGSKEAIHTDGFLIGTTSHPSDDSLSAWT
jgi:hypothetical protein